jgi:hypothetical protein
MFALLFPLINGHTLLLPAIGLCVLSAKWCNMYISIFVASWNLAMAVSVSSHHMYTAMTLNNYTTYNTTDIRSFTCF